MGSRISRGVPDGGGTALPTWQADSVFPFDPLHYRRHAPHLNTPGELLAHYRNTGWRRGYAPSPYLDPSWYRETYAIGPSTDPLAHFLALPPGHPNQPHPAFNARYYAAHFMAGAPLERPLSHYLRIGWRSGARPHPLFWSDWYAETYFEPGLPAIDPFYHYMTDGWRQAYNPNPLFSTEYYCRQLHEAGLTLPGDPLSHYIRQGHVSLDPHPLFRTSFFRQALEDNPAWRHVTPLEIYLTEPCAPNPCPLFDPRFFASQCASRLEAAEHASSAPLVQYLALRHDTDIDPHPFFIRRRYKPASASAECLTDYMQGGWRSFPIVHPLFDAAAYADANPGSAGHDPLEHYLRTGLRQGAAPRRPQPKDETPRPLPQARVVLDVSRDTAPTPPSISIGIFIHVYHVDLTEELIQAANNAPTGRTNLYISTDTLPKAAQINAICATLAAHPFEIRVMENRGRDIAPLLCGYRDRLADIDVGLHIHSKKSLHYETQFDSWRRYLLDQLLGTKALAANIVTLLLDRTIGAVMPDHFGPIRPLIQWGGNFPMISALLSMIGEDISPAHALDFPTGSMFWFRATAVQRLLDLNLRPYHFDPEQGQIDGTLAHALERAFLYFIESAGFRWVATRAVSGGAAIAHVPPRQTNRCFPALRELGQERRYYAECTGILLNPSPVSKPRLNLLVPTVDAGQGYGGVSTALTIFAALQAELAGRADARLLAADTPPSKNYIPPENYYVALPGDADREGDTVEDIAHRFRTPVLLRENDIFIATAWWTARTAFACLDAQDTHFGTAPRRIIYLIQDYEPGFYPWSTRAALAEQTYHHPERTIPVFNTSLLRDHFIKLGHFPSGLALQPPIDANFAAALHPGTPKEKIVLLYARPLAERNCLPFLDMVVAQALATYPALWAGWRFIAVGQDFPAQALSCSTPIEIAGRLSLTAYAALASRAAIGVALMISPHPSYPPLEMAAAGVLVLANTYGAKSLSTWHDNITDLHAFSVAAAVTQLLEMAEAFLANPGGGWRGQPRIDWFFDQRTNMDKIVSELAAMLL
jgi:hypothetical protein